MMPKRFNERFLIGLLLLPLFTSGQSKTIAFVSDTQEPMWIEDVFLKSNQNEKATELIFKSIAYEKPTTLYILGDVVSLGYKEKKWKKLDAYLKQCRENGIDVNALLGNHDVMTKAKKGEQTFQKRFSNHNRLGYVSVTDSVAIVLLNSNFKKLTAAEITTQQQWLEKTLSEIDKDLAIKAAIISCHHAPFTNNKIVSSSKEVQTNFVPLYLKSRKSILFITGHSHNFEYFKKEGKDFLVIGGGGGIHQPVKTSSEETSDLAASYKPMFHYLFVTRTQKLVRLQSYFLSDNFQEFNLGYHFELPTPQ
jgi:UDP-2,3-diacylglucosamine pyrophosphatase LpxH